MKQIVRKWLEDDALTPNVNQTWSIELEASLGKTGEVSDMWPSC